METQYNPELWKHLHWKDPISSFYFKRIDKPRLLVQDSHLFVDTKQRYTNRPTSCIYCGGVLTKQSVIGGILSDPLLAILGGLPYDIFESSLNDLFKVLKQSDQSQSYIDLYNQYKSYRDMLWSHNYYYVHKECQSKRDKVDFIHIDFEDISVNDIAYYDDNVKRFLYEVFQNPKKHHPVLAYPDKRRVYILEMYEDFNYRLQHIRQMLSQHKSSLPSMVCISCIVCMTAFIDSMNISPVPCSTLLTLDTINTIQYYDMSSLTDQTILETFRLTESDPLFCIFVRSYLNMVQSLKNCVLKQDIQYSNAFCKNVVNVSNYIWNIWSEKHSIQEAILQGDRGSIGSMLQGESEDAWTQKNHMILFQKINEFIGAKLSGDAIQAEEQDITEDIDEDIDNLSLVEDQTSSTMKQDLETMDFRVNGQPILF